MITKEELKELDVSVSRYSRELAIYLDEDWDNAFYQHINRVVNGEVEATHEEDVASLYWLTTHQDPHSVGAKYWALQSKKKTVEVLRRYMRSGVYNNTQIERMFSSILELLD